MLARDEEGIPIGDLFLDCKTIDIDPAFDAENEPQIDLLPLIRYCEQNPGIRVICGNHGCPCDLCQLNWSDLENGIHALFRIAERPKLREWLDNHVAKITLQFEVDLRFRIKKGRGYDWMFDGRWDDASFEQLRLEIGFPFLDGAVMFTLA